VVEVTISMKVSQILILFLFTLLSLLSFISLIDNPPEKGITKVDCYDEFSNKILDLKCESEITESGIQLYYGATFAFSFVLLIIGFAIALGLGDY